MRSALIFAKSSSVARSATLSVPTSRASSIASMRLNLFHVQTCGGVFNWYSSFGYAATDEQNCRMVARAFDALRPGGKFAMDVPNFFHVVRSFQPQMVKHGTSNGNGVSLIRESEIDIRRGRLNQVWTWNVEGKPTDKRHSSLRIYWPNQMCEMLEACGFHDVRLFGNVRNEDFTIDSPRLLLVAERPTQ